MKVQIDENRYLTGSYCIVGGLDNSIEMKALPDCEMAYITAYKLIHKIEEKKRMIEVEVPYEVEIQTPILDEEGNETGEYEEITVTEYKKEEQEVIDKFDVYFYELDEKRLEEIKKEIANPVKPEVPVTTKELNEKIVDLQQILCNMYETMNL
jgi:hypothetical protein